MCHVESSRTRDHTRVPCIGPWILNHWTPRGVLSLLFKEPLGYKVQIETLALRNGFSYEFEPTSCYLKRFKASLDDLLYELVSHHLHYLRIQPLEPQYPD